MLHVSPSEVAPPASLSGKGLETSLVALWCNGLRGEPAERSIQQDAENLLALYMAQPALPRPAIDVRQLAHLRGCEVQSRRLSRGSDGLLVPGKGRFTIIFNSESPAVARTRFTIAHEVAHTFLYAPLPDGTFHKFTDPLGEAHEEGLCDYAAGLLLIPETLLAPLDKLSSPLEKLIEVARRFSVSNEVAARRLKSRAINLDGLGLCEWIQEDIYLKSRKARPASPDRFDPFVLSWFIPPHEERATKIPRQSRMPKGSLAKIQEQALNPDSPGIQIQIGSRQTKYLAHLHDVLPIPKTGPRRILATIDELTLL